MSRNAPPKERLLTSELHSFLRIGQSQLGSIFRNLFAPDSPFETRPITYRFLSRSSCGKVSQATQDKWRRLKKLFAKRRQSSKFPSLMLTRSLQLEKFSSRRKMFLWKVLTGQTRLISSWSRCDTWPYSFALTRISPSDFALLYEMMGGSLYISLSSGWSWIKCHLLIKMFLRFGKAGWYVVTKGRIFFRTSLFFCKADFRSVNLTSEVIFSMRLWG